MEYNINIAYPQSVSSRKDKKGTYWIYGKEFAKKYYFKTKNGEKVAFRKALFDLKKDIYFKLFPSECIMHF